MRNQWTGGQYSLFRALLGLFMALHFLRLIPWGTELFSSQGALALAAQSHAFSFFPNPLAYWNSPGFIGLFLASGVLAGICLAIGLWDRWAAVFLWLIGACLLDRNPLILNPHLPYLGWLLLAHACLPRAPYGSWEARRLSDRGASWSFPSALYGAAWLVVSWTYSYSGYRKAFTHSWTDGTALSWILQHPMARDNSAAHLLAALPAPLLAALGFGVLLLEFLNGPLALFRVLRPWVWAAVTWMHLVILAVLDFPELTLGMLVVQGFLFDPGWIKPRKVEGTPVLFYDGACGLCHRTVVFILAEDRQQPAFRFAPLQGKAFKRMVPAKVRAGLPDSLVVRTPGGILLTRSDAVLFLLETMGGLWRLMAWKGRLVPRAWRDRAYDVVARVRSRLFKKPKDLCPLGPKAWAARFEA
ncbi:MAG TPA: DCC1-like thiol-disulfide oxidoreductase family protein [bacterium]|nr:DCC1-like thiol-disulfide oxidoreductase family protein [bacterium]